MKMCSKPLALIVIVFALLLCTSVCAGAEKITGTAGDLTWTVDTVAATLTITGSGEIPDYRYVVPKEDPNYTTAPWFDYKSQFNHVMVGSGVTRIGNHAFHDLSIKTVSLPNTLVSIGDYALNSYSLTTVTIPSSVTSVGSNVYHSYTEVTGLIARGVSGDTSWEIVSGQLSVSGSIPDYGWSKPTSRYDISHVDTPWFSYLSRIKSIYVSSGVTYIGTNAFYGCTNATEVSIPSSVTGIGTDAFANCRAVTSVYYRLATGASSSGWALISFASSTANPLALSGSAKLYANGSEVSFIVLQGDVTPYAFYNCANTLSVAASGGKLTKVGDYAFYNCTNLYEASLPTSVCHIGKYAFFGCTSLKETYCLFDGLTYVGDKAFYNCSSLTEVNMKRYANPTLTYLGTDAFYYCTSLKKVILGEVSVIPSNCFYGCSALTDITLPNSLTEISSSAFGGCTSLTSLTLPDTLQKIGSSAFFGCTGLTALKLPAALQTIGSRAFYGCTSLINPVFPDTLTEIGMSAYQECSAITSITFPASVQTIGSDAFQYCDNLTSVTFLGKAPTINSDAFYKDRLTVYYFPGSSWSGKIQNYGGTLTWKPVGGYCGTTSWQLTESGLLRIIGNGVLEAGDWGAYADRINQILVGPGVTEIGAKTFTGLNNATEIAVAGPVERIADDAFTGINAKVYWNQNDEMLCEFVDSFETPYAEGFGGTLDWRYPVCSVSNSTSYYTIRVTEHKLTTVSAVAPTCTEESVLEHWKCSCGMLFTDNDPLTKTFADTLIVPAVGHAYNVTFIWAEDGSACQAVFACQYVDSTITQDATITARPISDPDCLNNGETEYTALVQFGEIESTDPENPDATITVPVEYSDTLILADIQALGHTEAVIPGLDPTCEEAGMMECIFCEVCGEELQAAIELPALGHTETVTSEAAEPTCTTDGVTEQIGCSVCGEVLQSAEIIPMLGHDVEIDAGFSPDCLKSGLTEGSHCLTCGETLIAQEILPALGHTPEIDPGVEETDRDSGLTEGSHCSACGEILTAQQVIPARFTFDGDTVIAYNAADADVVIPDGATALGATLFKNNTGIRSVRIPDSVETLGTQTFFGCTGLEDLWLPGHLTNIGPQTFYKVTARFHVSADSATAVALSYRSLSFTTEDGLTMRYRVTSAMGTPTAVWIVDYCGNEERVVIPAQINGTPVTQIQPDAFQGQAQLTSVTIPDSVTSIGEGAFANCANLVARVSDGSYAHQWCVDNRIPVAVDVQLSLLPADRIRADVIPEGLAASIEVTDGSFHAIIDDDSSNWDYLRTFQGDMVMLGAFFTNPEGAAYSKGVVGNVWSTDEEILAALRAHDIVDDLSTHGHALWLETAIINPENGDVILNEINDTLPFVYAVLWLDENGEEMFAEKTVFCYEHTKPDAHYTASRIQLPASSIMPNVNAADGVTSAVADGRLTYTCENETDVMTMLLPPDGAVYYSLFADRYDPYAPWTEIVGSGVCLDQTDFPMNAVTTRLICWYDAYGNLMGGGDITVSYERKLLTTRLPAALTVIEAEAFLGSGMQCVIIPDACINIGARAFANCTSLSVVHVPDSVRFIAEDAFEGCGSLTFICSEDSAAAVYARAHGFTCQEP